jgi:hypothetical protein
METIKTLESNVTNIKVPEGYKVIIDPELIEKEPAQVELDGCLLLLREQEELTSKLGKRIETEEDEEVKNLIQQRCDYLNEAKRLNLIKISELTEKLK